ncbi:MAG: septal ring lytic transglycosylase RlpA family protein [Mucispirillum sp.]|nr:septal ring lytic transglycosylase RlpA family protein [Mucispirillum sp.]
MKLFKLTVIFMLIFLSLSCAAQNEVQIKSYEDYFPANTGYSESEQDGYDTYTYDEPAGRNSQVTEEGKDYSDDGFFQEAPVEIDAAVKSTGKCKAVTAPGPKKIGKPYKINGVTYYPMESADGYSEVGIASWYGPGFHGKLTANGEKYNQKAMTAAHKTLPLPTLVKVENLENGKSVVVRVNDRGPYSKGRIIDLTEVAAKRLGMIDKGTAKVRVSVLSEDPDCYVTAGHKVNIDKGNFAVQIGAFTDANNAKRLAGKFGSRAVVSKGYAKGTEWSRVWVTGYSTKEQALQAVTNELAEYSGAFVVRYK